MWYDTCNYYATAILNANLDGNFLLNNRVKSSVLHLLRSGWTTVENAKDSDKVLLEIGLILINKVRLS